MAKKKQQGVMTTADIQPEVIEETVKVEYVKSDTEFVEFIMDANVHWLGKNYKVGDQDELNIEDVEKLKLTKHVKIIERKK